MAVRQQDPAHLLDQIENLSRTHREHELYYSQAPLDDAAALQRISRTLKALAGHWRTATPLQVDGANRYAGCDDLNVQAAIEQLGVLFLEGEGEPAEITPHQARARDSSGRPRTAALLTRTNEILDQIDFTPAALRADLAGRRLAPRYLYSAAELIDHAADLLAQGAVLVHESGRRWRIFSERIESLRGGFVPGGDHAGATASGIRTSTAVSTGRSSEPV